MKRSPFVLAALISMSVFPRASWAVTSDNTDPKKQDENHEQKEEKQAAPRELSQDDLASAFDGFQLVLKKNELKFYGTTSERCMSAFRFEMKPGDPSIRVTFNGGPASCLSYSKEACGEHDDCQKLSETSGARMKLGDKSGTIKIKYRSKTPGDPTADIPKDVRSADENIDNLLDKDGKEFKYVSAADIKKEKQAKLDKEKKKVTALCEKILADCKGLPASFAALDYLENDPKWKADLDDRDDYISKLRESLSKAEIDRIAKDVKTGRASALGDDREDLKAIVEEHPELKSRVADLLVGMATREIKDPLSTPKDSAIAMNATLDQLKSMDGLDDKAVAKAERELKKDYLDRALSEGAKSEDFKDAFAEMKDQYIADYAAAGCDAGSVQAARNPTCLAIRNQYEPMLTQYNQQAQTIDYQNQVAIACATGQLNKVFCTAPTQQGTPTSVAPGVVNLANGASGIPTVFGTQQANPFSTLTPFQNTAATPNQTTGQAASSTQALQNLGVPSLTQRLPGSVGF